MGGHGSGRRHGSKDTTEGYHLLDIRLWQRKGLLQEGSRFTATWSQNGTEISSIGVYISSWCAVLSYRNRRNGGEWRDMEYGVGIEWTPCHFGGRRPWFRCPGSGCGRRVAILYGGRGIFACRHCYQLAYESQRERDYHRALERAQKIRRSLGGTGSMAEEFPEKPKGMHWSTYIRLLARFDQYQRKSMTGFLSRLRS